MVRFRIGNKIRECKYWEEEEKKICRLCAYVGGMLRMERKRGGQLAERM